MYRVCVPRGKLPAVSSSPLSSYLDKDFNDNEFLCRFSLSLSYLRTGVPL